MKWKTTEIDQVNRMNRNTLMEVLEMKCTDITEDSIVMTMPVNARTHQPMGLLHGGASAALIESIGSLGSALLCDLEKEYPVGIEINANHINGVKQGSVKAIAKAVHIGRRSHVWQVDVYDESNDKLVCTGRLTMMIVQKKFHER